jgi:hypothetical protein
MLTWIAILLLPLAAQTSELPGEADTIYRVVLPGGEIRYGAVRETGGQVTVVFDEPWAPSKPASYARGRVEMEPEAKVARAARLEEEARKAGYVIHETPNGPSWVREEDLRFFKRAQEMVAAQASAPTQSNADPAEAVAPEGPSMISLWGPHFLVLAIGATLAAVVWKMLLTED